MADKPATERTEQPTPRRINKARSKGQIPQSVELTSCVLIAVLVAAATLTAPSLMQWFIMQMREGLCGDRTVFADSKAFMNFTEGKITSSIFVMCPILAAICIGSITAGIVIGGLNFAPGALELKLNQLSPTAGLAKIASPDAFVRLFMAVLKILFVGIIVWFYLRDRLEMLAALRWAWSVEILTAIAKIVLGMMIRVCIALLVIGVADVLYQKWRYIEDLKMTKQEVKEEHRDLEGAPEVKSRIRRIQIEMTRKRMLRDVPKAHVVLVNPTHVAVALRYEAKAMEAPTVVAKGAGHLAEKIREIARAYGVPIIRRPELARTIYATVEVDKPIPENLYVAVAEVLALIYRLRHRK